MWTKKKKIYYVLYCLFGRNMPDSAKMKLARNLRVFWAKRLASSIGDDVNIERNAYFTPALVLGSKSGVGINCEINGRVIIGENVMMAPEVIIYTRNHNFGDKSIPMIIQGETDEQEVTIGNDVWLGRRALILPGVSIGEGSIVGAGAVVTKDVEPYTIVAGNPAKVIKYR